MFKTLIKSVPERYKKRIFCHFVLDWPQPSLSGSHQKANKAYPHKGLLNMK